MGRFSAALGVVTAAALAAAVTLCVQADTYDISQGDIQIIAEGTKQTVIYGTLAREDTAPVVTGKGGSIRLYAEKDSVLHVTFQDAEVDFSDREDAAPVTVEGEGRILLELDGINGFTAGAMHAGVETGGAALYISDDREPVGILNAQGGRFAAGIGGGVQRDGGNVYILGGSINARGGTFGAGIGGGQDGSGRQIAVLGGQVSASGGVNAAGIGGGWCGCAENICIIGGSVTANGCPAVQELVVSPESDNLIVGDGFAAVQVINAGERIILNAVDTIVVAPAEAYAEDDPAEEMTAGEVETLPVEETVSELPETEPETEAIEPEAAEEAADQTAVEEPADKTAAEEPTQPETSEAVQETQPVNDETANEAEALAEPDEAQAIAMQNRDGADVEFTSSVKKKLWTLHTDCSAPVISISRSYVEKLKNNDVVMLRIYCGNKTITANLNAILSLASQENTIVLSVANSGLHLVKGGNSIEVPLLK